KNKDRNPGKKKPSGFCPFSSCYRTNKQNQNTNPDSQEKVPDMSFVFLKFFFIMALTFIRAEAPMNVKNSYAIITSFFFHTLLQFLLINVSLRPHSLFIIESFGVAVKFPYHKVQPFCPGISASLFHFFIKL